MKLSKIENEKTIQFEINKTELDLITLALDDYTYFLEHSLKTKIIRPLNIKEAPIEVTNKITNKFTQQLRLIRPMLKILQLFY